MERQRDIWEGNGDNGGVEVNRDGAGRFKGDKKSSSAEVTKNMLFQLGIPVGKRPKDNDCITN